MILNVTILKILTKFILIIDLNIIPNKALTIDQIPDSESGWDVIDDFALTFRGYDLPKCGELANSRCAKTLTELRASLFFEQRRYHHFGYGPSDEDLKYIRSLVKRIRVKVIEKEFE